MSKESVTTIQLSRETRDLLKKFGKMGETYDDVIKKLMKNAKVCEEK